MPGGYRALAALTAMTLCAHPACLQAETVGLGVTTDPDRDATGAALEVRWDGSLLSRPRVEAGWALGAQADGNGNGWVGMGVAATWRIGERAFFEGSFMPGYYTAGEDPLGGDTLFRTSVGLGLDISARDALTLSVSHFSNAGLEAYNPGANTLALNWMRRF